MGRCRKQEPTKVWERQKDESAQAFEAFVLYRDMGAERSLEAVAQKLSKSISLIKRWSREKNWVERVRAYENAQQKVAFAEDIKNRKDMRKRHIAISLQLQKKALKALENLKIEKMSAKEIREFLKMATDLERLSRTLTEQEASKRSVSDSDFQQEKNPQKEQTESIHLAELSDEELRQLEQILLKLHPASDV